MAYGQCWPGGRPPDPRPFLRHRAGACPGADTLAPMLTISSVLYEKIVAHARADHPDEACGVIAGPAGSDRPERFIAMLNAERSPTFYRFDSLEQLRVWRGRGDRGAGAGGIYPPHTPPAGPPPRPAPPHPREARAHPTPGSPHGPHPGRI